MLQQFDASRSLTSLEQDNAIIAVIEMSQSKWLVAAVGWHRLTSGIISDNLETEGQQDNSLAAHARVCR